MTDPHLELAEPVPPTEAPTQAPIELSQLKNVVKSRLFGTPPTPIKIGRFEVIECLGQGGMGIVYSAKDIELDRVVAIKLLREPLAPTTGDQLRREAQALARLSHPNVIAVFDVGVHEGQRFIAMEYVEGESLDEWLQQSRPLPELLRVFGDAAKGLAAAHNQGLVHRDFKSHNVLVGKEGRARVLDFGLAVGPDLAATDGPPALPQEAQSTATCFSRYGELLGTPGFMSPEQFMGESIDARSDQFSFGVALFEALFGTRPFQAASVRELSLAVVRGRFQFPASEPAISNTLKNTITRCLSTRREDRFSNMNELISALENARAEQTHQDLTSVTATNSTTNASQGDVTRYGTQQVERALARAAELESDSSRPSLERGDIVQAAEEAGLDPRFANQALDEMRPRNDEPAPRLSSNDALITQAPPTPPVEHYWGFPTSISRSRNLPAVPSLEEAELVIREIERCEDARGRVEFLGRSLAWTNSDLELHLGPSPQGGYLTLWRRNKKLIRRKLRLLTPIAAVAGFIAGVITTEVFGIAGDISPLVGAAGSYLGVRLMRRLLRRHQQTVLQQADERLKYLLDRASSLLELPATRLRLK